MLHALSPFFTVFSTERDETLPYPVVQPRQTHGDRVVRVDRFMSREELEGVDALVTDVPGLAIGVRTADCIPVLVCDPVTGACAAIHAGWRSTVQHIAAKAMESLTANYGSRPDNLLALIGPGIGPDSFQVGDEVVEVFLDAGFVMDAISRHDGPRVAGTMQGGWHIDLWEANRRTLLECGIPEGQIAVSGICTYTHNDRFYSARREGIRCGRIINAIRRNDR